MTTLTRPSRHSALPHAEDEGNFEFPEGIELEQNSVYCSHANERIALIPDTPYIRLEGVWSEMRASVAREFLTILAMRADGIIPRDEIVHEIWPEIDLETGLRRLNMVISYTRKLLGPELGDPECGAIRAHRGEGLRGLP
jgi:hypothetical protein